MNDEWGDFASGVKSMGSFTLSGRWDDTSSPLAVPFTRRVQIVTHSFSVFGVSLWAERMEFDAEGQWLSELDGDGLTVMTADMRIVSAVETVRSGWWRRGLYYTLRPFWRMVQAVKGPAPDA